MTTKIEKSTQPLKYTWGQHPNSRKNLRPGNPPVDIGKHGYSITSAIKHLLSQTSQDGRPNHEVIAETMIELAKSPDKMGYVPIVKEILDRTDGKVAEKRDVTFNGEGLSDILGKLRGYNQQDEALSYKIRPLEIESRPVASPEIKEE